MDGSFNEFRQIAHVSAQISQDHMVTAFHFLISNRGAEVEEEAVSSFPAVTSSIAAGSSTSLFSSAIFDKKKDREDSKNWLSSQPRFQNTEEPR